MSSSAQPLPGIVVLISGSGTNLQAILDAVAAGQVRARILKVISNRPGAGGLSRAQRSGVPVEVIDHRQYPDRASFDRSLQQSIDAVTPELVVLAGFMRILTKDFVRHFRGRMLNIHPALLPLYPGLDTHARALTAGDAWHGATVHFVTEDLDAGPSVIQARVPVQSDDTPDSLARKVQVCEHVIYPQAIAWFVDGRLRLEGQKARFDGEPLPSAGVQRDIPETGWAT